MNFFILLPVAPPSPVGSKTFLVHSQTPLAAFQTPLAGPWIHMISPQTYLLSPQIHVAGAQILPACYQTPLLVLLLAFKLLQMALRPLWLAL